MKHVFVMCCFILFLTGCTGNSTKMELAEPEMQYNGNPTAADILDGNPDADILQFEDLIYQTGIDWVDAMDLTKDEVIGEIKQRTQVPTESMSANKLPEGTKIYSAKDSSILIAERDDGDAYYYAMVEG